MRRPHLTILCACVIAAGVAPDAGRAASGPDLRNSIELCRKASDNPAVISACSVVIGLSKDQKMLERAYNRRGLAEERSGQFDLAASDFSNVIRIDPKIAGYFDNRMRAYKAGGHLDLALQDADKAVAMAPTYAFPLHGRGAVYFDKGNYGAAVRDFSASLAINAEDASVHVDRGRALMRLGDIDGALRDFDAARFIDPANEPALRERGMAYAQLGRTPEARSDLAAAVAIAPADDDAARALRHLDDAVGQRGAVGGGAAGSGLPDGEASTAVPRDRLTPESGAPICTDKGEMQEYLLAAVRKDEQWMAQLKSCTFVKGWLPIAVIDLGEPRNGMHVDKVRIFEGGKSLVGYTLTIDRDGG